MKSQLETLPMHENIPQWLTEYFYKANAGNYDGKQSFYAHIKPYILTTFGEFDGYDLQVIKYQCRSCGGTGTYKYYHYENGERYFVRKEPCWHCIDGIYQTKRLSLERYLLNGYLYHIPLKGMVLEPHKNTINGLVEHEKIDPEEAYRAYIILLFKYNKVMFYEHVRVLVKKKFQWIPELIQSLLRKDNSKDELPF